MGGVEEELEDTNFYWGDEGVLKWIVVLVA